MYLYFAIFGAIFEVGAIAAVGTLAWRARRRRSAHWTLAAAIAVTLALGSWLILVQPVNSAVAEGASWSDLRLRWEIGHLIGFVFSLTGFVALAIATVRDIPVVDRTIHVETSRLIHAPPDRCVALYLDFDGWSRLFPATIRSTRNIVRSGATTTLDVERATAGTVPNIVAVASPREIVLDEVKPHYRARFVNRFDTVSSSPRSTNRMRWSSGLSSSARAGAAVMARTAATSAAHLPCIVDGVIEARPGVARAAPDQVFVWLHDTLIAPLLTPLVTRPLPPTELLAGWHAVPWPRRRPLLGALLDAGIVQPVAACPRLP